MNPAASWPSISSWACSQQPLARQMLWPSLTSKACGPAGLPPLAASAAPAAQSVSESCLNEPCRLMALHLKLGLLATTTRMTVTKSELRVGVTAYCSAPGWASRCEWQTAAKEARGCVGWLAAWSDRRGGRRAAKSKAGVGLAELGGRTGSAHKSGVNEALQGCQQGMVGGMHRRKQAEGLRI